MAKVVPAALLLAVAPLPVAAAGAPEFISPEVSLTAPTALMIDVGSGRVLYARDEHRRFLPASLTKIMTAYVAFELIDAGKLHPLQRFHVDEQTFREWSGKGSTLFLPDGADVTVEDLLNGIITVSANDACVVLAKGVAGNVPAFTAMMNAEARKLGMRDSHYNTPNGWMDQGRTWVSAADLAKLSAALITRHPKLYAHYFGHERMAWNGIDQPNHNPLYGVTAGADGVKTGFTNEAGYGFVGSAIRNGRRVLMVVGGYDRAPVRRDESRGFIEWAFAKWDAHKLFDTGQKVGTAQVQGGAARQVTLAAPQTLFVTLPKGTRPLYSLAMRYKGPLQAPIARGADLGTLVVTVQGGERYELPLVAADNVAVAGPFERLRNGLLGLVGL